MMRRMQWLTFARLNNPSYPSLIRRFYVNLSKLHKHHLDLICTLKGIDIKLYPSTMCRILGVNNDGDEVYDSNNWPILPNFNAQATLKRVSKYDSWHPSPNLNTLLFKLGFYSYLSSITFFFRVGIGVSHPIWICG